MLQAVVAQVIAEGTLGEQAGVVHRTLDAEVGFRVDRQLPRCGSQGNAVPRQGAGKCQFGHAFGQGHDGGQCHGRRAAHKNVHSQRHAAFQGRRVMDSYAAVNLIVQSDFTVERVLATGELHTIHAQVGVLPARLPNIFTVNLRQRDERPSVIRP